MAKSITPPPPNNWLAIAVFAAMLAPLTATAQQQESFGPWYLEMSLYSSEATVAGEDSEEFFFEETEFLWGVIGLGVGYDITPKLAAEGRWRVSSTASDTGSLAALRDDGSVYSGQANYEVSYSIVETSVIYRFGDASQSVSFHLRGGVQSFFNDSVSIVSRGGIVSRAPDGSGELRLQLAAPIRIESEGDFFNDTSAFLGLGAHFRLGPKWHLRAEYLIEDDREVRSLGVSAGHRF